MSRTRRRKPSPGFARYGAPAAFLAGVTIAVLLVHSALNHSSSTTTATVATTTQPHGHKTTTSKKPKRKKAAKRFYTVESGDTYGTIASKVGISVDRLQSLNPGVSSNALRVGQKLRVG